MMAYKCHAYALGVCARHQAYVTCAYAALNIQALVITMYLYDWL